jgi:hypothetical protein
MAYLILNSEFEARERSRQAWLDHLGRNKNPEDVTEFLWGLNVGGLRLSLTLGAKS